MPAPVRIGLIGNSFASKVQLPALRQIGGNIVVGIAGADETKAEKTARDWGIPKASGDWRDIIALDCDLVILTTPVHLHAPMVRAALETRAAILCEKPFTMNAPEARELADKSRGRLALIDHQLRWSPWRRRMREMYQSGFVGELWTARAEMVFGSQGRLDSPYTWWYDRERGGGMLGAIGSHMIDSLLFDLGPIDSVRARLATYRKQRPDSEGVPQEVTADEHATLWLRLANGAEASIETNIMAPAERPTIIEYVGSEGTLRLVEEETLLAARHGEPLEKVDLESDTPRNEDLGPPDSGVFSRVLPLYLRDVLQAVRTEATTLDHAATFEDGLATMRIIDAARASADTESWIPCRA